MSKLKFWLFSFLLLTEVLLLAFSATGCAAPVEPIPEKDALAACRGVLEDLQAHDSYHLRMEMVDTTASIDCLRQGEDLFYLSYAPDSDFLPTQGYLSRNGQKFNTEMADPMCTPDDLKWAQMPYLPDQTETFAPWLYTYQWDEEDVTLVSVDTDRKGTTVLLHFLKPYFFPTYNPPAAQEYEVAFRFDTEWTFQNAVFRGFFHHDDEDMAEYDQYRQDRMIIVTTDEAEIAAFLDHEFQRAVEQNQEEQS